MALVLALFTCIHPAAALNLIDEDWATPAYPENTEAPAFQGWVWVNGGQSVTSGGVSSGGMSAPGTSNQILWWEYTSWELKHAIPHAWVEGDVFTLSIKASPQKWNGHEDRFIDPSIRLKDGTVLWNEAKMLPKYDEQFTKQAWTPAQQFEWEIPAITFTAGKQECPTDQNACSTWCGSKGGQKSFSAPDKCTCNSDAACSSGAQPAAASPGQSIYLHIKSSGQRGLFVDDVQLGVNVGSVTCTFKVDDMVDSVYYNDVDHSAGRVVEHGFKERTITFSSSRCGVLAIMVHDNEPATANTKAFNIYCESSEAAWNFAVTPTNAATHVLGYGLDSAADAPSGWYENSYSRDNSVAWGVPTGDDLRRGSAELLKNKGALGVWMPGRKYNLYRIGPNTEACTRDPYSNALTDATFKTASWDWVQNSPVATTKWGDLADWDVSRVKDFSYAFSKHRNAAGGSYALDGNTKVTSFSLTKLSKWSTTSLTTLLSTFSGADAMNANLRTWSVGKVTTLEKTFEGAARFAAVGLDAWITVRVTAAAITAAHRSRMCVHPRASPAASPRANTNVTSSLPFLYVRTNFRTPDFGHIPSENVFTGPNHERQRNRLGHVLRRGFIVHLLRRVPFHRNRAAELGHLFRDHDVPNLSGGVRDGRRHQRLGYVFRRAYVVCLRICLGIECRPGEMGCVQRLVAWECIFIDKRVSRRGA